MSESEVITLDNFNPRAVSVLTVMAPDGVGRFVRVLLTCPECGKKFFPEDCIYEDDAGFCPECGLVGFPVIALGEENDEDA